MIRRRQADERDTGADDNAPVEPLPVCAVIPAYRRAGTVGRAVRSALAQTRPPARVLVVDDGSGDDTAQAARAAGADVLELPVNRGQSAARNAGIATAAEPWIALLDSDDEWFPHHLERLWAARDGHVLLGARCVALLPGHPPRLWGYRSERPEVIRAGTVAWPENPFIPSAVLVERAAVLAAGGFAEDEPLAEDLDLWWRLLEERTGLAVPQVGAAYHVHGEQASADRDGMKAARLRLYARYRGRSWYDGRLPHRFAALDAWDGRDAQEIARAVARPQGAFGLAAALLFRRRKRLAARREVARLRSDGLLGDDA
jgi:glycosyltransferase involved in cell wall biosynthesis